MPRLLQTVMTMLTLSNYSFSIANRSLLQRLIALARNNFKKNFSSDSKDKDINLFNAF